MATELSTQGGALVSGFIDSSGRVGPLVESNGKIQQVDGFAVHTVAWDDRHTLFGTVGMVPITLLTITTAVMVLIGVGRRKKLQ